MTALVAFLHARLDEDERLAQAASSDAGAAWTLSAGTFPALVSPAGVRRVTGAESVLPHVGRHDPARVLAEVEAKRRILDVADRLMADAAEQAFEPGGSVWLIYHATANRLRQYVALPYADHPDYDPAWRP